MKTALLSFIILFTTPLPQEGIGHFSKEGLAFDYPAGWRLEEDGDAQMQRLTLTPAGRSNIIMVFAQRRPIKTAAELYASRNGVTMPYVENIAHKLGLNDPPSTDEAQCVSVGDRYAVGFRMTGQLEGQPTTAEVYTIVLGERLIHLVNVRADRDEAAGAAAWKTLLDTLRVEGPAQPSPESDKIGKIVMGGVLNGKVVKKPQPEYPPIARSARASGTVTVYVVVNEQGKVETAQAVAGHTLLQGASVEAARKATFTPTTLCGRPVKVSGVITYNYVLR